MDAMGIDLPLAVGLIECLWNECYERVSDRVGDAADVAKATHYGGDQDIAAALAKAGFLDRRGRSFYVHDFWDHVPRWVRRRKERGPQLPLFDHEESYLAPDAPIYEIRDILREASKKYNMPVGDFLLTPKHKNMLRVAHGSKPSEANYAGLFQGDLEKWRYFADRVGEDDWACGRDNWRGMKSWAWAIERADRYLTIKPADKKRKKGDANMRVGEPPSNSDWVVDLYRKSDLKYQEAEDWEMYIEFAMAFGQCEAPPYEGWQNHELAQFICSRHAEDQGVVQSNSQPQNEEDVSSARREVTGLGDEGGAVRSRRGAENNL
jgi:hypothetical protein